MDEIRDVLDGLIAADLAQVGFVQRDTVQFVFEDGGSGPALSFQCWVWPRVRTESRELQVTDPGFRDELCDLIGSVVTGVSAVRGVTIEFGDRALIIDPHLDELTGPEVAMLHPVGEVGAWVVWRPGEDSFAHLA